MIIIDAVVLSELAMDAQTLAVSKVEKSLSTEMIRMNSDVLRTVEIGISLGVAATLEVIQRRGANGSMPLDEVDMLDAINDAWREADANLSGMYPGPRGVVSLLRRWGLFGT